ncbi:S-methyl-5-thioribose-1-phosphate isomerase [bacterium]|nr:S-methyl-5-thioribose-1-phosphate isomerase [bacterium]
MQPIPDTVTLERAPDGLAVRMIDQTLLPTCEQIIDVTTIPDLCEAIRMLRVRGAPAIGCAAACGVAMAAGRSTAGDLAALQAELRQVIADLAATRPTAVNLFWALERMRGIVETGGDAAALRADLEAEARAIVSDDLDRCHRMGRHGAELIPAGARILTHCNAGALATAGYGTALGVIRAAAEQGKVVRVYADETRPLLQGARLTAWELCRAGIPCTVICDNMSGSLMARGEIDCVVLGADRIAANGDFANKIGTYGVAVLARHHGIPFYVAAPISTVDYALASGAGIPIEQRDPTEVAELGHFARCPVVPAEASIYNPAFDVTPAELVTAIITEKGVARAPFGESLGQWRK